MALGKLYIVLSEEHLNEILPLKSHTDAFRGAREKLAVFGACIVEIKSCGTFHVYVASNGLETAARARRTFPI